VRTTGRRGSSPAGFATAAEQALAEKQLRGTERAFQRQIETYARLRGWLVYSIPDSRRATSAGFPDLVLCHPARRRLAFCELKTDEGRVRAEQRTWLDALASVPGLDVCVWRQKDWPGIQAYLDGDNEKEIAA
jgi:hypothetical protein